MPAPLDPQMLQMLLAAAKQKQAQMAPQIALTPKDMSQSDIQQKAMGMGMIDPLADVQPKGGVDQAPAPILDQTAAGQGAPPQPGDPAAAAAAAAAAARAKGSMPAPAPAPVAPGGELGPGVTMDPTVTIKPTPPQALVAPSKPSGSDMPDPHAPEPQDEEPDEGDDGDEDDASALPFRFAV